MKKQLITDQNRKWWTLGTISIALLIVLLDATIVNVATPSISKAFSGNLSQIEWVNNAYLMVFAVLLILGGRLGDLYGRKKILLTGISIFAVGSLLCGLSTSISFLIFARIIQGIGGSILMPSTLSIIQATFSPKERGAALGVWGAVAGLSVALGPLAGGYLTEYQNWRWIFFINLPIAIVALYMGAKIIKESRESEKPLLDITGAILSVFTLLPLIYGLIEGQKFGWWKSSAYNTFQIGNWQWNYDLSIIPILFLLSIIMLGIFIYNQSRPNKKQPLVNLQLFLNRNFTIGNITAGILNFAQLGAIFLMPIYLQSVLGFTPMQTGVILTPMALAIMFSAPFAGKLTDKFGAKWIVFSGLIVTSIGMYMISHFAVNSTQSDFILPFLVFGLGLGFSISPLTTVALSEIDKDNAGDASGILSATRQIGALLGIAILGAFLQSSLGTNVEKQFQNNQIVPATIKAQIIEKTKAGDTSFSTSAQTAPDTTTLPPAAVKAMQTISDNISSTFKQAFTDSINGTTRVAALVALIGALSVLALRQKPKSSAR